MMKQSRWFLCIFAALMGVCTLIFIWQVPASSSMAFRLSEAQLSLETAQGRERKQQAEYDRAVQDIQAAKEQLEAITPQHEEVQAVQWASLETILEMIEDGRFIPYEKSLIRLLFWRRDHRSSHTREDPAND